MHPAVSYAPDSTIMHVTVPLCTWQYNYAPDSTIMSHSISDPRHVHDFRKVRMICQRNICVPAQRQQAGRHYYI